MFSSVCAGEWMCSFCNLAVTSMPVLMPVLIWFLIPLSAWQSPLVVRQGLLHLEIWQVYNKWPASSVQCSFATPHYALLYTLWLPSEEVHKQSVLESILSVLLLDTKAAAGA